MPPATKKSSGPTATASAEYSPFFASTPTGTKRSTSDVEDDEEEEFTWNCDQVRRKIRALIDSGDIKVTEFQRAISVNSKSYGRFMKLKGPWRGIDNSTMEGAHRFFRLREAQGITTTKKRKTASSTNAFDVSDIHLDGEEEDNVEVYDSCDEIRRKINAHIKKDGVTQAQFLKDLAATFKAQNVKLQSKQLNDFRGKSGPGHGNTSRIFYAAYVFFEKLRIKEGKPKTKHRQEMEATWGAHGGFDTKTAAHKGVWCFQGEVPVQDKYGKISFLAR